MYIFAKGKGELCIICIAVKWCVFPDSILYEVYSVLVVDLLCRVEYCVVYMRAGKTCDLVVHP